MAKIIEEEMGEKLWIPPGFTLNPKP